MLVLKAEDVSKRFLLRHNAPVELKVRFLSLLDRRRRGSVEEFWALRGVTLGIEPGEAVGLVGKNGSGKSTFLKMIAAIHRPTSGRMLVARHARISSMIELGVGFHGELTGRENVFLNAAIQGLTRAAIEEKYDAIVRYSGLGHFMDIPIKNYSSGMYMRLGFAIAANMNPDILLLDEIFAVGDADFQQQCIATVRQFLDAGKTIVFVSHAPSSIRTLCRRVCVLDHGTLAFDGSVEEGLGFYERGLTHRIADGNGSPIAPVDLTAPGALTPGLSPQTSDWPFEFLRREGLKPDDSVLEVGGGSSSAAAHFLRFLNEHHYWGIEGFDLDIVPNTIDIAIANSLFSRLPFNSIARCIAAVVRKLAPGGRFFATWFENPNPANFEPIVQKNGVVTYPDREPYHYPFELIRQAGATVQATVERVAESGHPQGESVMIISRKSA